MKYLFTVMFFVLSLPGMCQEADDKFLEELDADRKKQTETAVKLNQMQDNLEFAQFSLPEELKKIGHKEINANTLMDKKVVALVRKILRISPLKKLNPVEVRVLVLEKVRGKPLEGFFHNNPKVVDAIVEVLRDEKALPALVGVFLKKNELKAYLFILLGIMVITWAIKKYTFSKDWGLLKSLSMKLALSLVVTICSLTIFYNMFHTELSPTVEILIKHWQMS